MTGAVHSKGGKIFLQLWHIGRMTHPDLLEGKQPIAPSALPVDCEVHTANGKKKVLVPRALKLSEISGIIDQFALGAKNAMAAGFDGVEIHGAYGCLLDQFMRDGSNHRTDEYGGSLENRARLPLEIVKAVIDVCGPKRVGYRISPNDQDYSMNDRDPVATFSYLAEKLSDLDLGYLHIVEAISGVETVPEGVVLLTPILRNIFKGVYMVNGGYDADSGRQIVERGDADLVSFGALFIANPDLPKRFKSGLPLSSPDPSTFYSGGEKGYIDYRASTS